MCAIVGMLTDRVVEMDEFYLNEIIDRSSERGTDSFGALVVQPNKKSEVRNLYRADRLKLETEAPAQVIANLRAEPTTEWVQNKDVLEDTHPFIYGNWAIVHNGTIANDKEVKAFWSEHTDMLAPSTSIDSAVIAYALECRFGASEPRLENMATFFAETFVGSYAVLAVNLRVPDSMYAIMNYKPLYVMHTNKTWWLASQPQYMASEMTFPQPTALKPYSVYQFTSGRGYSRVPLLPYRANKKALVVASGGLDSTVAAAKMKRDGYEVDLLHFRYGCRAQAAENRALHAIANRLGCPMKVLDISDLFWHIANSSALLGKAPAVHGDAGAEFAHEWVPARNLVMLSIATAMAENEGYGTIVLGNNLEESGAYPDNEMEFINKLNAVMPYAVGPDKSVHIAMPVGHMMKHQIVKLGLELDAPMDLTWSCYENGVTHCGECGPCRMRRVAFQMNKAEDSVTYQN